MDSLAPAAGERPTLARAVRDDREIREAVLADDRVFHAITDTEDAFIHISSYLFFTVLLLRARRDLQHQGYTMEREGDFSMPVFDSDAVCAFLQPAEIRDYLVGVLAGFVKTEQRSVTLRRQDGKLRRMRVNGLDLRSLIRYCKTVQEEHRFHLYRHIADLCLFASGVFAADRILGYSPATWIEQGTTFYALAAGHRQAGYHDLGATLSTFSENFALAAKPLKLIAERYLGSLRDHVSGA